jgi:hypothetical protein
VRNMASGGGDSGLVELAAVSPLSQFHAGGARGWGADAVRARQKERETRVADLLAMAALLRKFR